MLYITVAGRGNHEKTPFLSFSIIYQNRAIFAMFRNIFAIQIVNVACYASNTSMVIWRLARCFWRVWHGKSEIGYYRYR